MANKHSSPKAGRVRTQKFILTNRAASLATVSANQIPHVATVFCTMHEDMTVYFASRYESRKLKNLVENPIVAMNFTDVSDMSTLQLTGQAEVIEDYKQEQEILYELLKLRYKEVNAPPPTIQMYMDGMSQRIVAVKVVPSEITYATFHLLENGRYHPKFSKIM